MALLEPSAYKMVIEDIESLSIAGGSSFLQKKAADVRLMRINWQSYLQGQMIDPEEFNFITRYDNAPSAEARDAIIKENPSNTAKIFLLLLNRISKETTVQYLLTMMDDMLQEDKSRVELFRDYMQRRKESLWPHLFCFLQRNDPLIMNQGSRIISKIACWSTQLMEESDLVYYLTWLRDQLKVQGNEYIQTVARNLQMMLRIRAYRQVFVEHQGIEVISSVLTQKLDAQIRYQLIFCLWCLSFDQDLILKLHQHHLVPTLADIMCETTKEKVVRITAALFRHLLEKLPEPSQVRECALAMVQCKVLKQLEVIQQRKLDHDPELMEDLQYLTEKMHANLQDVSSLDEYVTELRSGRLEWSPVHQSEKFWRENAYQFNEKNYELLKILVRLLESSAQDSVVLAVAAHDLGEYVRHYPRGKHVIEQLGGKTLVMGLLNHTDLSVRYHALIALQKIMVHNWEYLGKQLDSAAPSDAPKQTAQKAK